MLVSIKNSKAKYNSAIFSSDLSLDSSLQYVRGHIMGYENANIVRGIIVYLPNEVLGVSHF